MNLGFGDLPNFMRQGFQSPKYLGQLLHSQAISLTHGKSAYLNNL